MPQIPRSLLGVAFNLYSDEASARSDAKSGGTGFFIQVPSQRHPGHGALYAVTNWHVAIRSGATVMRLRDKTGAPAVVATDIDDWSFSQSSDLAICPIPFDPHQYDIASVPLGESLTEAIASNSEVGPGDDVFMMGRFVDGAVTSNSPALRFGNISTLPVQIDPNIGAPDVACYILDLRSRGGFSGSPVFCYRTFGTNLGNVIRSDGIEADSQDLWLLGVHCGQFREAATISTGRDNAAATVLSGMTFAIPAWYIGELMKDPKIKQWQSANDEAWTAWLAKNPSALECAGEGPHPDEGRALGQV